LNVGSNVVTVSGTNIFGDSAGDNVMFIRGGIGTGTPHVNITNDNASLSAPVPYSIGGTNNIHVVGTMVWTNLLSGSGGTFPAAPAWTIPDVGLVFGNNDIYVLGTNALGSPAGDSITISVLTDMLLVNENTPAASSNQNGYTWGTAFEDLQDAIASASTNQEIWVAAGVYYPDEAAAGVAAVVNGDPLETFEITGYKIYGGFVGTETILTQRNTAVNISILSGDIGQNDNNGDGNNIAETPADIVETNSYHVVKSGPELSETVLDGFTITAGDAKGIETTGGGLSTEFGSPTIRNCNFVGNRAEQGGGIYDSQGQGTFSNCLFAGNLSTNGMPSKGGAILLDQSSSRFFSSTISNNTSAEVGGGISSANGSPVFTDCLIIDNNSAMDGGGIFSESGLISLNNCTVSRNSCDSSGGGIFALGGSLRSFDCIVNGNSAMMNGGGIAFISGVTNSSLVNCLISGNSADGGGGIFAEGMIPPTVPVFVTCTIRGNKAASAGGGVMNSSSGTTPNFQNCIIWSNQSAGSTATTGASVSNEFSAAPEFSFSIVANSGGSASWNNDIGMDGGSNLFSDPIFIQPISPGAAPTVAGDFGLEVGSAAYNTGNNNADLDGPGAGTNTISDIALDLAGNPRILFGTVDIGAYEFLPEPGIIFIGLSLIVIWLRRH